MKNESFPSYPQWLSLFPRKDMLSALTESRKSLYYRARGYSLCAFWDDDLTGDAPRYSFDAVDLDKLIYHIYLCCKARATRVDCFVHMDNGVYLVLYFGSYSHGRFDFSAKNIYKE